MTVAMTPNVIRFLFFVIVCVSMATAVRNCKKMTAFNVGLIFSVPESASRQPRILEALKQSDADFMCMQEVWFEKDMADILDAVRDKYPHHYSKIHAARDYLREPKDTCLSTTRRRDTSCSIGESVNLSRRVERCANQFGCFNETGIAQGLCISTNCRDVLRCKSVRETCVSCVFLNSVTTFQQALLDCTLPGPVDNRPNTAGLLVLSKTPIRRASYHKYFPDNRTVVERGYIEAELDDGKLAICTHLTSIFPIYFEYGLDFGSYLVQAQEEINILGRTHSDRNPILIGDFNTGPVLANQSSAEKTLAGEYPDNYDLLLSYGFSDPYLQQDGRCTYCLDNPLTLGFPNNVIDQVLIKTGSYVTPSAQRVFDTAPPLSDHYGVQVQVCDP